MRRFLYFFVCLLLLSGCSKTRNLTTVPLDGGGGIDNPIVVPGEVVSETVSEQEVEGRKKVVTITGTGATDYRTKLPQLWSGENYSGITWIEGNKYAVVSDNKDGFYIMELNVGAAGVSVVSRSAFYGDAKSGSRDCEGIVYHPGRGTLFIAGEGDQQILEYRLDGSKTGNRLTIPAIFAGAAKNYGFEALTYDRTTGLFWTTTESTLPVDGGAAAPSSVVPRKFNYHRLQSFGEDLQPKKQYAYRSDALTAREGNPYAFGVSAMAALPDGRLLVLEREFAVSGLITGYEGSFVTTKIYLVDPSTARDVSGVKDLNTLADDMFLEKTRLVSFKTYVLGIANYEGMCLGPELPDGSRALLLINDSQNRYKNVLGEYIKMMKMTQIPDR